MHFTGVGYLHGRWRQRSLRSGDNKYSTLLHQQAKHRKASMCNHPSCHDLGQPTHLLIVAMHWAIIVSLSRYKRNNHAVHTAHSVQACSNLNPTPDGRKSGFDTYYTTACAAHMASARWIKQSEGVRVDHHAKSFFGNCAIGAKHRINTKY